MTLVRSVSNQSALHQYVELLVRLHSLISEGRGDGELADELRDLMDASWYRMSEAELRIARQASADLYLLNPGETIPFPIDVTFTTELATTLAKSKEQNDYITALEQLRLRANEIGAHRALSLMSICYSHLGLSDLSILFAQRSIEFAIDHSRSYSQLLLSMIRAGKREAALALARKLLEKSELLDPEVRLLCATLFLGESHFHENDVASRLVEEAIKEFSAILGTLNSQQNTTKDSLKIDCFYFMGEASYLSGNTNVAIDYLNRAIKIHPLDEKSLILRGLLRLRTDFKSAIKDFSDAIACGTHSFEAYYYVAYDALASESFDECIHFAQIGLIQSSDAESKSELHEMIAYSLIGNSKSFEVLPVPEIRRHFLIAMRLAPFDAKYEQRLQEFEAFVEQNKIPKQRALKPEDVTIKGIELRAESYLAAV